MKQLAIRVFALAFAATALMMAEEPGMAWDDTGTVGSLKVMSFTPVRTHGLDRIAVGRAGERWCLAGIRNDALKLAVDATDVSKPNDNAGTNCPAKLERLADVKQSPVKAEPLYEVVKANGLTYIFHGAGVRVVDESGESPREVGQFHTPRVDTVAPTAALVDARGYIYFIQAGTGMWILSRTDEDDVRSTASVVRGDVGQRSNHP